MIDRAFCTIDGIQSNVTDEEEDMFFFAIPVVQMRLSNKAF